MGQDFTRQALFWAVRLLAKPGWGARGERL
jgi:hypothetical protein